MKAGWETKSLADTCKMYQPKTISGKEMKNDGAYPVFGANGIIGRYDQFNHAEPQLLITCRGATCGSVNVSLPNSWITGNAMVVRPKDDSIDLRYLEYYFRGGIDISVAITGAAQPQITRTNLDPLTIQYPTSLEEQRRIVAVLDKAFAGIATATANAQKNLVNARALFESYLFSVVECATEQFQTVALIDIASDITDGDHLPPPKTEAGVPFITIGNIDKRTRKIDFSSTFKVSQKYFDGLKANRKPQRGDVLFTVTGSFGIPVIVEDDVVFCFQRHIGLIRPKPTTDSKWLNYLLMSPQVFKQAEAGATGTAQKTVSLKALRSIKVPQLAPAEQARNVALLDKLSLKTAQLELAYQKKVCALFELKQSLLQKAFAGELI